MVSRKEDTAALFIYMIISGIAFIARGILSFAPANYWDPPTIVNFFGILLSVFHWGFLGISLIYIPRQQFQNEGALFKLWFWIIIVCGIGFLIMALGSVFEGLQIIPDISDQLNLIGIVALGGMFFASLLGIASRAKLRNWSWFLALPLFAILIVPDIGRFVIGGGLIIFAVIQRKLSQ